VVCCAVYINWKLTKNEPTADIENTSSNVEKTLGEAKFVNNNEEGISSKEIDQSEYFGAARLNKKKTREESLTLLKSISEGANNDAEAKKKALEDIRKIALNNEREERIEQLVKAKGFTDCVALIGERNVNIIVSSKALKANEVAIIKDIAINESSLTADKVIIVEMK
jgi:stage III sporulation protein AH